MIDLHNVGQPAQSEWQKTCRDKSFWEETTMSWIIFKYHNTCKAASIYDLHGVCMNLLNTCTE